MIRLSCITILAVFCSFNSNAAESKRESEQEVRVTIEDEEGSLSESLKEKKRPKKRSYGKRRNVQGGVEYPRQDEGVFGEHGDHEVLRKITDEELAQVIHHQVHGCNAPEKYKDDFIRYLQARRDAKGGSWKTLRPKRSKKEGSLIVPPEQKQEYTDLLAGFHKERADTKDEELTWQSRLKWIVGGGDVVTLYNGCSSHYYLFGNKLCRTITRVRLS